MLHNDIKNFFSKIVSEHKVRFFNHNGFMFETSTDFIHNLPSFFLNEAEIVQVIILENEINITVSGISSGV